MTYVAVSKFLVIICDGERTLTQVHEEQSHFSLEVLHK